MSLNKLVILYTLMKRTIPFAASAVSSYFCREIHVRIHVFSNHSFTRATFTVC